MTSPLAQSFKGPRRSKNKCWPWLLSPGYTDVSIYCYWQLWDTNLDVMLTVPAPSTNGETPAK